jgi:hypothetical protein
MKLPSVAIYAFAAIALLTGESEARLGAHRRLGLYFSPNGRGASGRGGPGGGFSAGAGYDELDNEDVGGWGFSGNPRGSGGFAGNGMTVPFADETDELDNEGVGSPWGNNQVSGPGRGWDKRSGMPNLELPYFGKANDELDNEDVGGWGFSGNPRGSGFTAGNGVTNPIQLRL